MSDRFLGYERDELDRQYDMAARHGDSRAVFAALCERLSDDARARFDPELDVPYGPDPAATMDLFPATRPGSPVIALFPGGYWSGRDKRDAAFVALGLVPRGCGVAVINHGHAPATPVAGIVEQACRAALWLHRHPHRVNGAADRIVLAGQGAGAHLAAMALTADWSELAGTAEDEEPPRPVAGVAAISGLFDLEPLRLSFLNARLQLDMAAVARLSPLRAVPALPQPTPPVFLAVGEHESDEYHRQLAAYARALEAQGAPVEALTVPGHHHFSVVAELANPSSPITNRVIALAAPAVGAESAPI